MNKAVLSSPQRVSVASDKGCKWRDSKVGSVRDNSRKLLISILSCVQSVLAGRTGWPFTISTVAVSSEMPNREREAAPDRAAGVARGASTKLRAAKGRRLV